MLCNDNNQQQTTNLVKHFLEVITRIDPWGDRITEEDEVLHHPLGVVRDHGAHATERRVLLLVVPNVTQRCTPATHARRLLPVIGAGLGGGAWGGTAQVLNTAQGGTGPTSLGWEAGPTTPTEKRGGVTKSRPLIENKCYSDLTIRIVSIEASAKLLT